MGWNRFAGDVFNATKGKKKNALLGSANSGFDLLGTARAIGSQVHPLAGAVDDIVSTGENIQKVNTSGGIQEWGENAVGAIGSTLSAIGSVGPVLGAKTAASLSPIGLLTGLSTMVAKPAVEGMQDPVKRQADANEYRKYMMR